MAERLSAAALGEWKRHPVTKTILQRVAVAIAEESQYMIAGNTIYDNVDETAINTAGSVGKVSGLRMLLDIEPDEDEPEEKE